MKHLLIFAILVVFATEVSAQKPWKWTQLNGPNMGSRNAQLLFGPNGEIISVGNAGYYQTTNDGNSWEYHKVISEIPCIKNPASGLLITSWGEYYFYFGTYSYSDADSCGSENKTINGVYRSTDSGNTWKHILAGKDVVLMTESADHGLFFTNYDNPQLNDFPIYESIDKGNSWTSMNTANDIPFFFGSTNKYLYYFAKNTSPGYIFRMLISDGKVEDFRNGMFVSNIRSALQVKSNVFMVAGYNASLNQTQFFTSDGESQWSKNGSLPGFVTIYKGTGDTVFSLASSTDNKTQSILITTNLGHDWHKYADLPLGIGEINCENSERKLFENDTALYLSRDRGNSWREIGLPIDSLINIVVSGEMIFAERLDHLYLDNNNYSYRYLYSVKLSSDNGKIWQKTEPAGNGIAGLGKGINGSVLAVAPDSNETWNSVWLFDPALPSQWIRRSAFQNLFVHPLIGSDKSNMIYFSNQITSSNPFMYRSDDTAFTWTEVDAPNDGENVYSMDVSDEGIVYYGTYPALYRSEDHGSTWSKLIPTRSIVQLSAIKTFGMNGVLLGTKGAGLLKSTDKGNSWLRIDGNNFDTVTCIGINSKQSIAAGTNHGLWFFDSDKQSWSKVTFGMEDNLYIGGIDVAQNDDFYVGTYGSSVWKGTRNNNAVKYLPSNNSAMQISPNPTNGKIIVTLNEPSEEQIRLELYDILGRRIAVLAGGRYSGENQINFNTSDLTNGIYTLILSGEQNETQKIVVQH